MSKGEVRRVFWGWERPVLEVALEFLTADLPPDTTLDLADTVLLVPTAEAGRRLRRALADWAHARGGAVSVPHVWPPHLALSSEEDRAIRASELQGQIAWVRALEKTPPKQLHALLPKPPESLSWSWLKSMAGTLSDLQETLGAGGLSMADVAASSALPEIERARWQNLALLEAAQRAELSRQGFVDVQTSKRMRARRPVLPVGVRRIVVLAAPDLPPLLEVWLAACAQEGTEVILAVHAPEVEAAGFDAIGRPLPEHWAEEADLELPLNAESLHPCCDPGEQADTIMARMRQHAATGHALAIGVCDGEISTVLKERLEAEGLSVFDPGGVPARRDGFWHLLSLTAALAGEASWSCLAALVRIKEVRTAWGLGSGGKAVAELDRFACQHLPGSVELAAELLADLPDHWRLTRQAVQEAWNWRKRLREEPLPEVAHDWLVALQGDRQFNTSNPADHQRTQLAWAWLEEVNQVAAAARDFDLESSPHELWALVMERLEATALEPVRGDVDLVLQGWLELLWEPAPALLVAGMNEEFVPGVLNGHAFLPDSLRQALGLPCQRSRFARDAYLLRALLECRRQSGYLDLICGRWSRQGDARKPSRLLMLCPSEELPQRVALLFPEKETPSLRSEPPRTLAWALQPESRAAKLDSISPSRLKEYLRCPYRFYLRHVLKMEAVNPPGREMDAMGFGEAIHAILNEFGLDEEARALTDERAIQRWQDDALERWIRARFGRRPPPLVRLQVEAAAQRLHALADVEAIARRDGWEIIAVELVLGGPDDSSPLLIDGVPLSGQVDRVERHRGRGELRLIDFKTAEKANDPLKAHCVGKKTVPPEKEWRLVRHQSLSKPLLWIDLQLPLYAAALRQRLGQPVNQVAYGCLPKAVLDTRLLTWEAFDEDWEKAALSCAEEAVRRIRSGLFWPPEERVKGDLDAMFMGDPMASALPPV